MTVEGLFNPSHLIRTFLAHEYAFSIFYPKHEIRIAHGKGTWSCVKIRQGQVIDWVIIQDMGTGNESENEMTKALFDKIQQDNWENIKYRFREDQLCDRDGDSLFIENALTVWGGKTSSIEEIVVVQPGRNASVDERTGEYILHPRIGEFVK